MNRASKQLTTITINETTKNRKSDILVLIKISQKAGRVVKEKK